MKTLAFLTLLVLVGGCADRIAAVGDRATEEGRALKDAEARALIDSTCLMGIGAWNRLTNPNEQVGSMLLCGGQTNELLRMRAGAVQFDSE